MPERRASNWARFRPHPALRDFVVTGISSFLVTVAAMVVISVLGRSVGPVLLGEYLLVRRMASWIQAGVQLPSGVALPRFVAFASGESALTQQTYFLAAMLVSCAITLVLGVILVIWRNFISHLFFGSAELDRLVLPLCLFLLGLAVNGVVFGYFQGKLEMVRASLLQSCSLAVVPVVVTVLLSSKSSIPWIVNAMGACMCGFACAFAWPVVRAWEAGVTRFQLRRQISELVSYGGARIVGDVGLQALLSLPAVVAVHYFSIGSVSFLLLGGTFVTAVGAACLPLANVLLSRVSRSIAQMRMEELRLRVTHFVDALIVSAVLVSLQLVLFADVMVRAWVGASFLSGIRIIQITILAVPFYLVYAGLRSVIDAAAVRAYNTRNIMIAGCVFLVLLLFVKVYISPVHLLEGLAASGVGGIAALAICTLRTTTELLHVRLGWFRLLPGVILAILFGGLSFTFHQWRPGLGILLLAFYEFVLMGSYFAIMWMLNSSWVHFFLGALWLPTAIRERAAE